MAMNVVIINGNLGKDPEIKVSQSGTSITRFSLAVKGNRKDENGEYKTNWINCLAFSKTAELIANHCKKGDKIGVRGSLETGSYVNKEGVTVYTSDVIVQELEFLTNKQQGQQQVQQQQQQPMQQQFQHQQPQYQQMRTSDLAPTFGQPQQQQQVINQSELPF